MIQHATVAGLPERFSQRGAGLVLAFRAVAPVHLSGALAAKEDDSRGSNEHGWNQVSVSLTR
jgi:hypothetical protein